MKKITVKVRANAGHEAVEEVPFDFTQGKREGYYRVAVKAKPVGGQANKALIKLLAKYFKVPAAQVRIVFGKTSREKMVEVGK